MKELRNLEMEATMKNIYIKPEIKVIPQIYGEGVMMETLSLGAGSGGATNPPDAKPGGEWDTPIYDDTWGDAWAE